MGDRIVALVDMDCFYCQVETRLNPSLKGKPLAVVQYNQWKGGGIIAVNYEARAFGVSRHLRGQEAKEKCPDIVLVSVPAVRGKADLTKYRDAGQEVIKVLCKFSDQVERASVDEAYIDLTKAVEQRIKTMNGTRIEAEQLQNTFIIGYSPSDSNDPVQRLEGVRTWIKNVYEDELYDPALEKLAVAGVIVEEMRAAVYSETQFRCSAGIAHNKILSKLACGLHKPNLQSILPQAGVTELYKNLPVNKVRNLGGKLGDIVMKSLGCKVMADLAKYSENQLQQLFDEKTGSWLYNIARGIDLDPVNSRLTSKSIGCCKKFPGKQALKTKEGVEHWLFELSSEVVERLVKDMEVNKRRATLCTVYYHQEVNGEHISSSRCCPLKAYNPESITNIALNLIIKNNPQYAEDAVWQPPLKYLGLAIGKFVEINRNTTTINSFFKSTEKKGELAVVEKDIVAKTTPKQLSKKLSKLDSFVKLVDKKDCSTESNEVNKSIAQSVNEQIAGPSRNLNLISSEYVNPLLVKVPCTRTDDNVSPCSTGDEVSESFFLQYFKENKPTEIQRVINSSNNFLSKYDFKWSEDSSKNQVNNDKIENNVLAVPSTSKIFPVENEQWLSPNEIFPNIDDIDDEVLDILPSPMLRKIKARKQVNTNTSALVNLQNEITSDVICSSDDENKSRGNRERIRKKQSKILANKQSKEDGCDISLNSASGKEYVHNCENKRRKTFHDDDKSECSSSRSSFKSNSNNLSKKNNFSISESRRSDSESLEKSVEHPEKTNFSKESVVENFQVKGKDKLDSQTSGISGVDYIKEECPHCHKSIPLIDFPEHLDFHIAEDLHMKLNSNDSVQQHPVVQKEKHQVKNKKQDRVKKKSIEKSSKVQHAKIVSFFKPIK